MDNDIAIGSRHFLYIIQYQALLIINYIFILLVFLLPLAKGTLNLMLSNFLKLSMCC